MGACLSSWMATIRKLPFLFVSYSCFMISNLRLRRKQHIKGSHIRLISNATCITDAWTRFLSGSLNHQGTAWLSSVLITLSTTYSFSFKTSQLTQKSCKYKCFSFVYTIRLGIELIRWLISLTMGSGMQPYPICCVLQEQLDAIDHPFQ